MKRPVIALLMLLLCSGKAFGDCTPTYSVSSETDQGCLRISKQVRWVINWPDGYFQAFSPSGRDGVLPVQSVVLPIPYRKNAGPYSIRPRQRVAAILVRLSGIKMV